MSYALELLLRNRRIDGRSLEEFRKIEVFPGVVKSAEGSALVKLGDTCVVAGTKLSVGQPFPDSPEKGVLIVNAELTPLASPEFEPGPPGEDAIELARIVDRTIRESECIEFEKLFLEEQKVWWVFVDIHAINDSGNLLDASALASVASLLDARLPKFEEGKVIREATKERLPIRHKPVLISVCVVKDKIFLDPIHEEEKILDSKLCVGVREDDVICALQKQGKQLKFSMLEEILDVALEKSRELRKCLPEF